MNSDVVYKYKTFSDWDQNRFDSEMVDIKRNRLTLVSPESFNDPYDSLLPFIPNINEEDWLTTLKPQLKEEMRVALEFYAKDGGWAVSESIVAKFDEILEHSTSLDDFLMQFDQWNPFKNGNSKPIKEVQEPHDHFTQASMRGLLQDVFFINFDHKIKITREVARVACFSQEYDSMYFWSHYANSHKGICIEYTFKNTLSPCFKPKEVEYISQNCREFLIKKFFSINRIANSDFLVLTKSKDWASEKEKRVSLPHPIKTYKENMRKEGFLNFVSLLKQEGFLKKLEDTKSNNEVASEKCTCGEFMTRYHPPSKNGEGCACLYCEACDEKKPSQTLFKLEYPHALVTKIYLGAKFDENCGRAQILIETAQSKNIPVYKMELSKKEFSLKDARL